jgi:FkbH-like protein
MNATKDSPSPFEKQFEQAREAARNNDLAAAATALRRLYSMQPDYIWFARAEALLHQVVAHGSAPLRQTRITVLAAATSKFLTGTLRACAFRDRIAAEWYEGPYNSIDQEILNPASGFHSFQPNLTLIVDHSRALAWRYTGASARQFAETEGQRWISLWQSALKAHKGTLIHLLPDLPGPDPFAQVNATVDSGLSAAVARLREYLAANRPPGVVLVDPARAQRGVGDRVWFDALQWFRYQQHPSTQALPALAEEISSHIRAVLGLTRKVLVLDLDNTLWGGVIGEDGITGIKIGSGSPEGEAYASLQRYCRQLKDRGILLAICSKNNDDDAKLPFRDHREMVLRLEDFAAFRANWEDKATNLRRISQELSLGTESFVFLDDNPLEREWVHAQMPEIAVPELPASPFQFERVLDEGRYFTTLSLSEEDLQRAEQYRTEARRQQLHDETGSVETFLESLGLQAECEPLAKHNAERITQLVNKTNQFNVTTRRYVQTEVEAMAAGADNWLAGFKLSDRFGSYGLIGVLFAKSVPNQEWEIDTWLMSCRVLGRQAELFMFDSLIAEAQRRGIRQLRGVFRPTAKNSMVKGLYPSLGFQLVSQSDREHLYSLDVPKEKVHRATFINRDAAPRPH